MGSRTGSPTRAASPRRSPAKAAPKKSTPKKKVVKKPAAHPTYKEMIMAAIVALKQRGGSSRQAISKYISGHYKVGENANSHLKLAFRRAIASGMLVSAANHAGTYRLSKEALAPPKPKKKVTAKKPAAKKAKKPKAAKKTPAKKATPKKAKKPATKKKATPKKAKKPVKSAKKPTKKTPAKKAKKAPAKKAKK